ncbi:MAG TPA: hypothetical protein PK720_00505 [bacterium]|jgi:hypothetical protein|nr:hypothetical protein [bacterium]
MIESKLFSEKETPNPRPRANDVYIAILGWFEHEKKSPSPLYIREGTTFDPKLENVTFEFWAVPEIGKPNKSEISADPEDYVVIHASPTLSGTTIPDYSELTSGVYRSFNEAKEDLGKLIANMMKRQEAEKDFENNYREAI